MYDPKHPQPRKPETYMPPENDQPSVEPWAQTRPNMATPRAAPTRYYRVPPQRRDPWIRGYRACGCFPLIFFGIIAVLLLAVYLLFPTRTNVLILGIDRNDQGTAVSRTDTIILTTIEPMEPYIGMLSIPRDLWVTLPGGDENRINTAHFFAEAEEEGSGPEATMETIRQNMGVTVHYFARLKFDGVMTVAEAMGGVDIVLDKPAAGYAAGKHHLDPTQVLAFVRDRAGTDDFFRMEHGQFMMKSMMVQLLRPSSWPRLPAVFRAARAAIDTNVPIWLWPRLGFALLRAGPDGIDSRTITREMVTPFQTDLGAQVLLPNWNEINPVLFEMFGE